MAAKLKGRITRGDQNIAWIEQHCIVPDGRDVGKPVKVRPFQRSIIKGIYDTPTRRAIISMPRKNAKTGLAAMLLTLHTCGPESHPNSQLYSGAQSRDQAALVFDYAAKMVRANAVLSAVVQVRDTAKELRVPELGTLYKALSADKSTAYGKSAKFTIHDELGQVEGPRSELYDALETSSGAHDDPLSIVISTQAADDAALLSMLIDDAKTGADPKVKLFLYCADEDDDIFDERVWRKANPALGDFLSLDEFRATAATAKRMPSAEATFRNLLLNQRIRSTSPFIPAEAWKACGESADVDVFRRRPVFAGLDLSARQDLTSLVLIAQDEQGVWHVRPFFWTPSRTLHERAKRDRIPYDLWVQQGHIFATPGVSIDYEHVLHDVLHIVEGMDLQALGFDRWRIDVIKKEMQRLGASLPLQEYGQGFKDMAPAVDAIETDIANEKVRHGMNPVLTACAANVMIEKDPAGNRKFDKRKITGPIDGMVAWAIARGMVSREGDGGRDFDAFLRNPVIIS